MSCVIGMYACVQGSSSPSPSSAAVAAAWGWWWSSWVSLTSAMIDVLLFRFPSPPLAAVLPLRPFPPPNTSFVRAFCARTARSRSTPRGTHTQHLHSSGTPPSTMSKHAAWHHRLQSSHAMLNPSSYWIPHMQLMASGLKEVDAAGVGGVRVRRGGGKGGDGGRRDVDCLRLRGIILGGETGAVML